MPKDRKHGTAPNGEQHLSEQQRVFDRQVETLESIDNKAARIVRITVLTIGVVVSGASIIDRGDGFLPLLSLLSGGVGVLGLLSTVVLGLLTFDGTEYKTRLTDSEYDSFVGTRAISTQYREWSKNAQKEIRQNSNLLAATELSLFASVIALTTSGSWLVVSGRIRALDTMRLILLDRILLFVLWLVVIVFVVIGFARQFHALVSSKH